MRFLAPLLTYTLCVAPLIAGDVVLTGTVVPMTGRTDVIRDGAVLIRDGIIEEIVEATNRGQSSEYPFTANVDGAEWIETEGFIFPGLINIHNHTLYGTLPPVPVDQRYENRYEWQPDDDVSNLAALGINIPVPFNIGRSDFNPFVEYPRHLLTNSLLVGLAIEASKYSEIKGLVGGTTTIEGGIDVNGVTNILLRNAEHTNFGDDRIRRTVSDINDPAFAAVAAQVLADAQAGTLDAFLLHLAEGSDAQSLAEFDKLKQLNLLNEWTVIVHGVPFTRPIFDEMAAAGADLVWSPTSNLVLYGETPRVDQALEAGVNVSLGTDWGVSAPKNLLTSLKVAWEVNKERRDSSGSLTPEYKAFSEYELIEMVTSSPARSLQWEQYVGQLREGMVADILVVDKSAWKANENEGNNKNTPDPYKSLIRATERHVRLVMVGGDPLYGDESLMAQLKPGDFELIGDGTFFKGIDITKAGVAKGDQQFSTVQSTLSSAMNFSPFTMFATYPIVPLVGQLQGNPLGFNEFLFLFGYIFFDYLPDGTPFPPPPSSLVNLLAPGALALPLTPVYTTADPAFFDMLTNNPNANLPDIQTEYYSQ